MSSVNRGHDVKHQPESDSAGPGPSSGLSRMAAAGWRHGLSADAYTINGDDSAYLRENADLRTKILAETPGGVVAAAAAIEWAHQAGLTPVSVDELAAVFDGISVFVE